MAPKIFSKEGDGHLEMVIGTGAMVLRDVPSHEVSPGVSPCLMRRTDTAAYVSSVSPGEKVRH